MKRLEPLTGAVAAVCALAALALWACAPADNRITGPGTGMETGNALTGILMMDSLTSAPGVWVYLSSPVQTVPGPATKVAASRVAASLLPMRDSALTDSLGRFRFDMPGPDTLALLLESRVDSLHHLRLPIIKMPGVHLDLGRVSLQAWLKAGWELTFQDEFDADGLDTASRWVPRDYGTFVRNSERHAVAPEALVVRDGQLAIIAERRKTSYAGAIRDYTSGTVQTQGRFAQQYGRFEVRCRFPRGECLRPAVWMMADTIPQIWPPEIVLPNRLGARQDSLFMGFRGNGDSAANRSSRTVGVAPTPDGYRVVAVEWAAGILRWFVDGALQHQYAGTEVPQRPMFLIINLAVGGSYSQADPDADTGFPHAFEIDYVRVYRKSP